MHRCMYSKYDNLSFYLLVLISFSLLISSQTLGAVVLRNKLYWTVFCCSMYIPRLGKPSVRFCCFTWI